MHYPSRVYPLLVLGVKPLRLFAASIKGSMRAIADSRVRVNRLVVELRSSIGRQYFALSSSSRASPVSASTSSHIVVANTTF